MGWELYERYFVKRYGPDYDHLRRGRSGECAYCSGLITTETSRKITAEYVRSGGKIARLAQCAVEAQQAHRKRSS